MKIYLTKIFFKLIAAWNIATRRYPTSKAIFIFSHPRSGSTWLTDIIINNQDRTYITVYEPLSMFIPQIRKLNLHRWQYVPEEEQWPELQSYLNNLFSGDFSPFVILKRDKINLLKSNAVMAKFIKGNALLPWFTRQFALEYPPILLVRHPCAVVASQLRFNGDSGQFLHDYFRDGFSNHPYTDVYEQYAPILQSLTSMEEKLAATWCLSHLPAFQSERNNIDWITVFYEELLTHPESELNRIFERMNLPLSEKVLANISQPSFTTVNPSEEVELEMQIGKWRQQLHPDQITSIINVVKRFNIHYYTEELTPVLV